MDARHYLSLVRRQRAVIVASVLVLTAVALVVAELRPETYRATATVALVESDPLVGFLEDEGEPLESAVEAEAAFVPNAAVAAEAADLLGGGNPDALISALSVAANPTSNTITISATDASPAQARAIANAFAEAFVVTRAAAREANNEARIARFDRKLEELRAEIQALDAQLGASADAEDTEGAAPAATNGGLGAEPGTPEAAREALTLQYQLVFERQQDLRVQQDLQPEGVVVASSATLPLEPIGPGTAEIGAVAVLAGLMVGFALAVLRDFLNDRIQTTEQIAEILDDPILAELPVAKGIRNLDVAEWATAPPTPVTEAARILRTNLEFLTAVEGIRSLVVTSPTTRDGRTFITAQLAAVYAQAGYRVVAVSSDLRNPMLEAILDVPPRDGVGLSLLLRSMGIRPQRRAPRQGPRNNAANGDVVGGGAAPLIVPANGWHATEPGDVLHFEATAPTSVPPARADLQAHLVRQEDLGLSVLPAGPVPPNPAELLGSHFDAVLESLAVDADIAVLDSPPVPPVSDASILASYADAVLLVVTLGNTKRADLRRTRDTLANLGARVVGVVVNRSRAPIYAGRRPRAVEDRRPAPVDQPVVVEAR